MAACCVLHVAPALQHCGPLQHRLLGERLEALALACSSESKVRAALSGRAFCVRSTHQRSVQTCNVARGAVGKALRARSDEAIDHPTHRRAPARTNAPLADAHCRRAAWSLPQDVASEVASLDAALSAYSTRIKAAIIKGMPRAWRTGDEQAYVLRVDVSSMQV
jgi:hypothetical protein